MPKKIRSPIGEVPCPLKGCDQLAQLKRAKDHERGARYAVCPVHGTVMAHGAKHVSAFESLLDTLIAPALGPDTGPETGPEPVARAPSPQPEPSPAPAPPQPSGASPGPAPKPRTFFDALGW